MLELEVEYDSYGYKFQYFCWTCNASALETADKKPNFYDRISFFTNIVSQLKMTNFTKKTNASLKQLFDAYY